MTKAIILSAGRGTRLGDLGKDRPKCLVEVGGKALLDYQLQAFREAGISNIQLVGGHRSELLTGYGINVVHNRRYMSTNMVASMFCASDEFSGVEDLIVSYGDIAFGVEAPLSVMTSAFPISVASDKNWLAYWKKRFKNPLDDAETFKVDDAGAILEIGRKPKKVSEIEGQFVGLVRFSAGIQQAVLDVWQRLSASSSGKKAEQMYMTDFLQSLILDGVSVGAAFISSGWAEIDKESDIEVAEHFLSSTMKSA